MDELEIDPFSLHEPHMDFLELGHEDLDTVHPPATTSVSLPVGLEDSGSGVGEDEPVIDVARGEDHDVYGQQSTEELPPLHSLEDEEEYVSPVMSMAPPPLPVPAKPAKLPRGRPPGSTNHRNQNNHGSNIDRPKPTRKPRAFATLSAASDDTDFHPSAAVMALRAAKARATPRKKRKVVAPPVHSSTTIASYSSYTTTAPPMPVYQDEAMTYSAPFYPPSSSGTCGTSYFPDQQQQYQQQFVYQEGNDSQAQQQTHYQQEYQHQVQYDFPPPQHQQMFYHHQRALRSYPNNPLSAPASLYGGSSADSALATSPHERMFSVEELNVYRPSSKYEEDDADVMGVTDDFDDVDVDSNLAHAYFTNEDLPLPTSYSAPASPGDNSPSGKVRKNAKRRAVPVVPAKYRRRASEPGMVSAASAAASAAARRHGSLADEDLDPQTLEKRHSHNVLERKRRDDLNRTFMTLQLVVPSLAAKQPVPKIVILHEALSHIKTLRKAEGLLLAEKDALKQERSLLSAKLRALRSRK